GTAASRRPGRPAPRAPPRQPPTSRLFASLRHLAFLRLGAVARRHHLEGHRPAQRVAQAELELPVLGPVLLLVVLAHLHEDLVAAGAEGAVADVLVEAQAVLAPLPPPALP